MRFSDWSSDVCSSDLQDIDQRLAAALRRADRQAVDLLLVDHAAGGEEQHRRVGVEHEDRADEVLFARLHPRPALAAAPLRPVRSEKRRVGKEGGSKVSSRWEPYS